ncbi:MAG: hypothetical protein QW275_02870 [Candidatus Anstonellaceae archaeon]
MGLAQKQNPLRETAIGTLVFHIKNGSFYHAYLLRSIFRITFKEIDREAKKGKISDQAIESFEKYCQEREKSKFYKKIKNNVG